MPGTRGEAAARTCAELDETWARDAPARLARAAILSGYFQNALGWYCDRTVTGTDELAALEGPVVFVANHSSHIDTPLTLCALPFAWRRRTAVAAAADYFYRDRRKASVVSVCFNTVPVRRDGGGWDDLGHVHELLDSGWSLLMYPEGTRAGGVEAGRLRTGACVLAAEHGIPVVPVHLHGTRRAMPPGQIWPRRKAWEPRFPVSIAFGEPIRPESAKDRHRTIARVEEFFAQRDAELVGAAG